MKTSQSSEPNGVVISRSTLMAALLLVVVVVSITGTFVVTNSYYIAHPQISTVTSSTTATLSQTQTDTSYSTMTQTLVSTSVSTANGNFYYGNSNYNNYPNYNYNPYNQCQYPYYNSQCYGTQYQFYSGNLAYSGSCILFYTGTGTYYLDLSNLNGNPYPTGSVTIRGYIESPYYQGGGCGAFPLLYVYQIT